MKHRFVWKCVAMVFLCAYMHQKAKAQYLNRNTDSVSYVNSLDAGKYPFADTTGRAHSLNEFKGKYVYLDIWASWCYPCRKEYPFLRKLAAAVDTAKVQIVSVSIDSQEFRWRGAMEGFFMNEGTQWLAKDTMFYQDFDIDRIPRFILLDKNGKVFRYSATRPSHEETVTFLNSLN